MEIETQEQLEKYIFERMSELLITHQARTKEEYEAAHEKACAFVAELLYQVVCQDKLIM